MEKALRNKCLQRLRTLSFEVTLHFSFAMSSDRNRNLVVAKCLLSKRMGGQIGPENNALRGDYISIGLLEMWDASKKTLRRIFFPAPLYFLANRETVRVPTFRSSASGSLSSSEDLGFVVPCRIEFDILFNPSSGRPSPTNPAADRLHTRRKRETEREKWNNSWDKECGTWD